MESSEDELSELQIAVSNGNLEVVRKLIISSGTKQQIEYHNRIIPQLSLLHLAVQSRSTEMLELILSYNVIDINIQDQWGFSPLHYATFNRQKKMISILLSNGALANLPSKAGSTALDFSLGKQYDEISDLLHSKCSFEQDGTYPKFREWLYSLGAGEYLSAFAQAGYDLKFIVLEGLSDEDLDCVGIPIARLGLRKKLKALYKLNEFYTPSKDKEADEDDEDEEGEEESDDDESNDEGSDEEEEEEEDAEYEDDEDDDEEDDDDEEEESDEEEDEND